MAAVTVRLPDGSTREFDEGTTAFQFAESIGPRLAKAAVAATFDGREVDLDTPLVDGAQVSIVTANSDAGRAVLRHSTAHVLAQAVLRLWPGAHFAIGPVIEDGFYYDFELPGGARFSDEDLERIADTMRQIMAEDQPFIRHEHSVDEGLTLFEDQPFKREIIEAVGAGHDEVDAAADGGATVSTYWNSPTFTDLCRGPHVPSTSRLPGPTGGVTRSASSSSASTAPPGSRSRPWPTTSTGWPRPSGGTTGSSASSSTCSPSPRRSVPGCPSSIPRAAWSAA
jgi:threonyl-tRNA synthetase